MAENLNNVQSNGIETESFNIRDYIFKCLSKWYWFVISVVLCLGAAAFYLVRTPKIYTRSATVLIKESAVTRRSNDLESMLSAGGMTQHFVAVLQLLPEHGVGQELDHAAAHFQQFFLRHAGSGCDTLVDHGRGP